LGMRGTPAEAIGQMLQNGFIVPQWVPEGKLPPKDVPHPVKTLADPISLRNAARPKIPTTYILTYDKGKTPEQDDFYSQAQRASKKGWPVVNMEADHNPQWSATEGLVDLLLQIAKGN
ncbi:MAG TPA: hypothetical protein VK907_10105, partial [Phnomibacter sp.]|nr:hypothetical protein [Phnomibacter sp.]